MSSQKAGPTVPKSMRHKKILDIAAERPDASTAEIAEQVPSATADLVEHVLDEYGDPADEEQATMTTDEPTTQSSTYPSVADLTDKQIETLRAIAANPTAPQRELAEVLGISAATVSNRVNAIEGFEWDDRATFTSAVLADSDSVDSPTDESSATADEQTASTASSESHVETHSPTNESSSQSPSMTSESPPDDLAQTVEQLESRLATVEDSLESIEAQLESHSSTDEADSLLDDHELVHKVVHACMDSETITEDEELRILKSLLE